MVTWELADGLGSTPEMILIGCWVQRRVLVSRREIDGGRRAAGAAKVGERTVVRTSLGDAEAMNA